MKQLLNNKESIVINNGCNIKLRYNDIVSILENDIDFQEHP
jgi:hypothetical protein